ncbi:MAG: SemiSWEET family transporter [Cyclobacteriaceae bacterium]|nr:SemiSWEET family transporter [Cyclobacteriaceae bacterium]
MDWIQIAGHVGAFLSSITFIPQVYKVWKTKSVQDLSLAMMLIVASSTLIWLVYGIALMLWPVILANGFIFFLSLLLIYFKFTYSVKK